MAAKKPRPVDSQCYAKAVQAALAGSRGKLNGAIIDKVKAKYTDGEAASEDISLALIVGSRWDAVLAA